jgi:hypothetical protein
MEKIYESRRQNLKAMIEEMGRGAIAKVASDIEVDPNYLSRCLYPPGKSGRKNIGDEMVVKLNEKYPGWASRVKKQPVKGDDLSPLAIKVAKAAQRAGEPYMLLLLQIMAIDAEKAGATTLTEIQQLSEKQSFADRTQTVEQPAPRQGTSQ